MLGSLLVELLEAVEWKRETFCRREIPPPVLRAPLRLSIIASLSSKTSNLLLTWHEQANAHCHTYAANYERLKHHKKQSEPPFCN